MKKLMELKQKQQEEEAAKAARASFGVMKDVAPTSPGSPSLTFDGVPMMGLPPKTGAGSGGAVDIRTEWVNCSLPGIVCSRHPVDPRSLFVTATPNDLHVRFFVRVPALFPKQAPIAHCITPIFHPNISLRGNIGWHIVASWRPEMGPSGFLQMLLNLLQEPQVEFANNAEAAASFTEKEKFISAFKCWRASNNNTTTISTATSSSSAPLSNFDLEAALGAMTLNRR